MAGLKLHQMINSLRIVSCCFIVALWSTSSYALTVSEVVEKIVNNSPELKIILEKKEQSLSSYKGSRAAYLPSIYIDYIRKYEKNDPITDPSISNWTGSNKFQLVLEQRIFDMQSLATIARSSYLVQSQEFENQKMLESLIMLAVTSYYDVIQAKYIASVNQEYYSNIVYIGKLVYKMRNEGNATLGDVNLVQSKIASANTDRITSMSNLDKVKARLAYLLNLVSNDSASNIPPSELLPELTSKDFYDLADKMISFLPVTANELQKSAIRNNVDILLIRSNLCAAGYHLEEQKSKYLPTITATVTLKDEEQKANANMDKSGKLEIETKYYLYDGGARSASVQEAQSSIRELEYNYDIKIRDTRDKAYASFNQLNSLEKQRISVLKEIEAAEEVDKVYRQQFKFATRNLIDRLDNLDKLLQSRIKLIALDYQILNARINVLSLEGHLVDFFGFQNYLDYNRLNLC